MMGEPQVRTGSWTVVDKNCEIRSLEDAETGLTLAFGGQHDFVEVTFEDEAIDRLIETAVAGRDRLRAKPQDDSADDEYRQRPAQ
jgi:hypothetical protein